MDCLALVGCGPAVPEGEGTVDSKALRNQFNFSERAAQTQNNPNRDRDTSTEPPPTAAFNASCTQWEIYDAYMEDQTRQHVQKELARLKGKVANPKKDAAEEKRERESVMHGPAMCKAVKVMERMVNQNSFSDIADDFKYWEDASDQFRDGEVRRGRRQLAVRWQPSGSRVAARPRGDALPKETSARPPATPLECSTCRVENSAAGR